MKPLSPKERDQVRQMVLHASERIVPLWPMTTKVGLNPIHGQKYLPFDQAVRKSKHLLGGKGSLSNEEYQQRYRDGRITPKSLTRAFQRVGPRQHPQDCIQLESRQIAVLDVWRLHIIVGFEALEPARLEWELGDHGSMKQFHRYLSEESRKHIIDRTIQECELCREYPEKAYLANLWKSTLWVLQLNQSQATPQQLNDSSSSAIEVVFLPAQRTMSDWVDTLAAVGLVSQINDQLIQWITAFLDERIASKEMPQRHNSFYQAWRQLVQEDDSGTLCRIKGFTQRVNDLPTDPEDTIASSLQHLGIPQEQWREYLARQLSLSLGWMQYLRWLGEHPDYHVQSNYPIDTTQYLAVRMFYEVELAQITCQQEWGIDGTVPALTAYWNDRPKEYNALVGRGSHSVDMHKQQICRDAWRFFHLAQFLELSPIDVLDLSFVDAQTLLQWLDDFPLEQHNVVWLKAYEESFRADIL